ncbi:MAG: tetratricopeptide repeat protein [Gammaproteobacteria bacterium]|nr:tetratricopeptide repeat protein [Gammaproteobacteria bacterium]
MTLSREASSESSASASAPPIVTKNDIQLFFQTLINLAETQQGNIRSIATQLKTSYLAHIKNTLHQNADAFSKANMMKIQIDILANQHVFEGKVANHVIAAIKKDLTEQGRDLMALVSEEYHEEFIDELENMQATESHITPSTIPLRIETGLSLTEMKADTNTTNRTITEINELIAQCKTLEKNRHYAEMINNITQAITRLSQIFDLLPKAQKPYLFHYIQQLAFSYNAQAMQFQADKNFPAAIESLKKAIALIEEMTSTHGVESKSELEIHRHDLAHALGLYGVECRNQKQFASALQCFKEAIDIIKTFSDESNEVDKQNIALMRHHIGITEFYMGYELQVAGNYLEAAKKMVQAIETLKSIKALRPSVLGDLTEYRKILAHTREKHADALMNQGEEHCRLQMEGKAEDADKEYLPILQSYKNTVDFLMPLRSRMRGNAESRLQLCQMMLQAAVEKFNKAHPELNFNQSSAGGYKDAVKIISHLQKRTTATKLFMQSRCPLPKEIIFFGSTNKARYAELKEEMNRNPDLRNPGNR